MSVPSGLSSPSGRGFPNLENLTGPLLLGTLASAALWGVTCVQTYDYFIIPNQDRPWFKSVVALLCVIDTFETIMNAHAGYHFLVKNFTNPYALFNLLGSWSLATRTLTVILTSFIVCTMFARRIYFVSRRNIILTSWVMAISSAHLVVGILMTVRSLKRQTSELKHLIYINFSIGIATNVSITLSLCWFLYSARTGIRKTESIIKVLVLYIVTTGVLVVLDATVGLALYIVMPNNLIFAAFYSLLGKIYTNAFLASLNARRKLRRGHSDVPITIS